MDQHIIWENKPFDTVLGLTMSKLANGRVKSKFKNSALVQKSFSSLYSNFILSLYIVYELNTWPSNPSNKFTLTHCLFATLKLARNADKSYFTCNSPRIAFVGQDSSIFGNDFARNVVIFGFDNSSSYPTDNQKNNFLVLGEGLTQTINDSNGSAQKKLLLVLAKQIQNFV